MASLTVRQLEERLKKLLRLRAAKNGRSMEDEVRTILREAAEETGQEALDLINPPAPKQAGARPHPRRRSACCLIIGGGIAAYKSLDLIRRLKERGLAVRCILTHAADAIRHAARAGAFAGGHVFTDLFDPKASSTSATSGSRARPISRRRAGDRRPDGEDGERSRRRSRHRRAARDHRENSAGAGDEPGDVGERGDAAQYAQLVADGVQLIGPNEGEMAEAGERGRGRMAEPLEIAEAAMRLLKRRRAAAQGQAHAHHLGPDA